MSCLSWCWRPGDLESEDQGFSSHVFPVASCPLTHGSETWVLIAGLTFLGTHSFFCGELSLEAGLCVEVGAVPFSPTMPSPGSPIAHSTQVSFWVLAWKYPNITFWFRIPSTCMMKSLNFSLPHFLLKRIWRLSALTASKGCTDNHFRCLQESLEGKVESAYAYELFIDTVQNW